METCGLATAVLYQCPNVSITPPAVARLNTGHPVPHARAGRGAGDTLRWSRRWTNWRKSSPAWITRSPCGYETMPTRIRSKKKPGSSKHLLECYQAGRGDLSAGSAGSRPAPRSMREGGELGRPAGWRPPSVSREQARLLGRRPHLPRRPRRRAVRPRTTWGRGPTRPSPRSRPMRSRFPWTGSRARSATRFFRRPGCPAAPRPARERRPDGSGGRGRKLRKKLEGLFHPLADARAEIRATGFLESEAEHAASWQAPPRQLVGRKGPSAHSPSALSSSRCA